MIHNQRAKALFFLLTHPSVLHQGHFLFPEVFPCSRRSFPVPGGHFLFLKDHLTTPGNHLIAGTLTVKVTFLQITAHANVLQRCLEQGFVRAVICRNCAADNQQHHLPRNTCALGWQQSHPAPNTCAPCHAIAVFGGDTEVA